VGWWIFAGRAIEEPQVDTRPAVTTTLNILGACSLGLASALVLLACGPVDPADDAGATEGVLESTSEGATTAETDGEPVEETHVVLTACGLALACEPMTVMEDITPASAQECAQALYDGGQAGLTSLLYEVDGDPYPPFQEDAVLLLSDGRLLQQTRHRDCDGLEFCEDGPWEAWGAHEICSFSTDYFYPDNFVDCEEVPDWTCEEVAAAVMP
jgi:hypothetical protein